VRDQSARGRGLLLTGATGFLGKVVLETLLRRRDEFDFDRVFVLVRAPDPAAAQIRLEREVLGSECFCHVDEDAQGLVELLRGDVTQPGCGLEPRDARRVEAEVARIIHCAASVEFDLPLAAAAQINVQGALEVIDLAQRCGALQSLVMVSTAYVTPANEGLCVAEERLAPLPRPAASIYGEIQSGRARRDALLRETGHPNTYTLTKSLAEHLAVERGAALPLTIVRPSIISASRRYPFPGWIDSSAAFASVVTGIGVGQLRTIAADPNARIDIVPCDDVARCAVEAAYDGVASPGVPSIRHATVGLAKCATTKMCREGIEEFFGRYRVGVGPQVRYLGPDGRRFRVEEWLRHSAPMAVQVWRYRLFRQSAKAGSMRRLRERVLELNRVFPYFTQNSFDFRTKRSLSDEEFKPEAYIQTVCSGVHRHLLRQDPSELTFAGREHPLSRPDWLEVMRPKGANPARRFAALLLVKLLRRCAGRVTFDLQSLERARAAAGSDAEWLLLPTHRSYFDFLVLPYLFFARPELGVTSPEIAADQQFARIPVLSPIARRCGAFFLRRGLGAEDKELTRQVHEITEEGRPILFFVEGGRSRSRECLPPKRGLLRCLQGTGKRFNLLPMTVNYDRVPEEATFDLELQGKRPERIRLRTLMGWLGRVRRGEVDLGRIHVSFGQPLELDLSTDVRELATRVVDELERGLVATTHHLRCFLEHHSLDAVDLSWLSEAIRERGGRVLRSRLRRTGTSATIEATLQRQWKHLFRADRQAHLRGELQDPRLVALVEALFPSS
jgi:thioester reductase-like protein/1-acyl-sn-glycerol-3-phosphate acyltransferase